MAVENPQNTRCELIDVGVGVASGLMLFGLEVGARVHGVLIPQAPLIRDISPAFFLIGVAGLSAAMIREFQHLSSIVRESERASMLPPTLSNGPQSV